MEVICPLPLLNHLERNSALHTLTQDLILCYPRQSLMTAVWLKDGVIRLNEQSKQEQDLIRAGLYFLDELSQEIPYPHSVKVLRGSKLWLVTRSEVRGYLAHVLASARTELASYKP